MFVFLILFVVFVVCLFWPGSVFSDQGQDTDYQLVVNEKQVITDLIIANVTASIFFIKLRVGGDDETHT